MNSVMEIGEKIVFLEDGLKQWEGNNQEIFKTDNEAITKFVYSSEMFKKIRKIYIEESE
jgi:phospholipid/cholesterol/gamma-HCH transport system ATP-binding protein